MNQILYSYRTYGAWGRSILTTSPMWFDKYRKGLQVNHPECQNSDLRRRQRYLTETQELAAAYSSPSEKCSLEPWDLPPPGRTLLPLQSPPLRAVNTRQVSPPQSLMHNIVRCCQTSEKGWGKPKGIITYERKEFSAVSSKYRGKILHWVKGTHPDSWPSCLCHTLGMNPQAPLGLEFLPMGVACLHHSSSPLW